MTGTRPPAPASFAPNAEVYGAGYYERMYRPHWFLRNRRKYEERDAALLRLVRPTPRTRVLEVGSARGDTAFFFAPRVHLVVGIDASPVAVAAARAEGGARGLANARFEEADARDLASVAGGPYDVVLLADFVEHALDDVLVPCFESARRVLAPGGALAIYTPNRSHWAERIKAAVPGLQQEDHIAVRTAARVVALADGLGLSRRRPLLLRESVPRPRRSRPGAPDGRSLPFPDVPPGGNVRLMKISA